jgi:hypothetical protein
VPFAVNAGGLGWLKSNRAARIKDRVDHSLTFSGKIRIPKNEITCQDLSGSLGERVFQASRQNIVRNI